MTDAQWQEIERAVTEALDLPAGDMERFLAGLEPDIRTEVESLLDARHRAGGFLGGDDWENAPTVAALGDSTARGLIPGQQLGPYLIERALGAGGMGEVYQAVDTRLGRKVAIKIAPQRFGARFEREARAIAALNHPHVCTLYDVGPNYLVMEYIDGAPLRGPLALELTLRYGAQICDALDAAHKKSVTHRDLKPANILVTKAGIKLLDFGCNESQFFPA